MARDADDARGALRDRIGAAVSSGVNPVPSWVTAPVDPVLRARVVARLHQLRACTPERWDTGLSDAGARAAWEAMLAGLDADALSRPVAGVAPRRVGIVCSGNVFTAPVEWTLALVARGVDVVLKPASGQEPVVEALARAIEASDDAPAGRARVCRWQGGDVAAERAALEGCDAVIGFGGADAMGSIGARLATWESPPRWLPFGPKAGVAVLERLDALSARAVAWDHALHDGRGCMSPAAVFVVDADTGALADAVADVARACPAGALTPAEAASIRARAALARVCGQVLAGGAVLELPVAQVQLAALPRVVVMHRVPTVEAACEVLAPHRSRVGTLATDCPERVAAVWGAAPLRAPRVCAPGAMQRPPFARLHDGVDVLAALWGEPAPS